MSTLDQNCSWVGLGWSGGSIIFVFSGLGLKWQICETDVAYVTVFNFALGSNNSAL